MGFYVIVEILETGALMLISFVLLSKIQVSLKIVNNLGNPQGNVLCLLLVLSVCMFSFIHTHYNYVGWVISACL